ncbi:MAG: replicative DNA helicase [Kordiimonadaceae bacterium]|jgi:replicative DNA helicase|nr:replicative DNA helicase [Kordiimonadaceae bacterium]MBT6031598.1 replicative DNA helicase [Kordiimonadaceae bacterium]
MSDYSEIPIQDNEPEEFGGDPAELGSEESIAFKEVPHNLEAEQALLGAILINNEALEKVQDFLLPDHFANAAHNKIYAAASIMIEKGQLVTPVTLKPYFQKEELLEDVGGATYLAKLAASAITIINALDYGLLIYDLAVRRNLIELGTDIVNKAYAFEVEDTSKEQIEEAEKQLYSMAESGVTEGGFQNFKDSTTKAVNVIGKALQRQGKLAGVTTGFDSINKKIGGLHKSDLMIVAGRPAMGKTALATNIAFNCAKAYKHDKDLGIEHKDNQGAVVAFFSLEMSADQLASRILAEQAGLSSQHMRQGNIDQDEFNKLSRVAVELQDLPLFIDDTAGLSIGALRTRARRMQRQHGLGLVVVDYLQLLRGTGLKGRGPENRVQEVSEITRGLKGLAKELEIPVIALSQLSRSIESRDNKRPLLSDLRESGTIEQDADMVTFVYRAEYYHSQQEPDMGTPEHMQWQEEGEKLLGMAEFIIGKQRHGPIGIIPLRFQAEITKFSDLPMGDDYLPEQFE